ERQRGPGAAVGAERALDGLARALAVGDEREARDARVRVGDMAGDLEEATLGHGRLDRDGRRVEVELERDRRHEDAVGSGADLERARRRLEPDVGRERAVVLERLLEGGLARLAEEDGPGADPELARDAQRRLGEDERLARRRLEGDE